MRLTLFIHGLNSGGAERVLSIMASHWADQGHMITLLSLAGTASDVYAVSPLVQRIGLDAVGDSRNAVQALIGNYTRVRKLREAIRASRPDALISFIDKSNVMALAATRGLGIPVIVSERTDPRHHSIGKVWNTLRRITYPWADAIVVQGEEIKQWAAKIAPRGRIKVIPNPVVAPTPPGAAGDAPMPTGPVLIAMGRLSREKGFDLLLKAFALSFRLHPEWSLVILGEGSERRNLEAQACDLGLESRVHFPGYVSEPTHYLRRSELFVLSSRFEGFPNALLEAMACGLPVVSFDCPSGPRNIVIDGEDGILVPIEDTVKLSEAIGHLMSDQVERRRLGANATRVLDRFQVARIMSMWENVIAEVSHPDPSAHRTLS